MPKIKSAIKRVEVTERNRQYNRHWKSAVRTVRTSVEDLVKKADTKAAAEALQKAYSVIDTAVSKGVMHKNSAARRKSRLTVLLSKVTPVKPKRKTSRSKTSQA